MLAVVLVVAVEVVGEKRPCWGERGVWTGVSVGEGEEVAEERMGERDLCGRGGG